MKRISKQELFTYTKPTIFEIASSTYTEKEKHYPDSLCLYVCPHCEWDAYGAYLTGAYFETEYSYETLYLTREIEWVWVYEEQDLLNLRKLIDGVIKGVSVLDVECKVLENGNLHLRGYYLPKDKQEYYLKLTEVIALREILENYTDYTVYLGSNPKFSSYVLTDGLSKYHCKFTDNIISKILGWEGFEFTKGNEYGI
jgi:hypothetical protein